MRRTGSIMKRTLCVLLAMLMLFDLSGGALAATVAERETVYESEEDVVVYDSNGEVVERDDDWDEVYPYGAFAFAKSSLALKEGGEDGVIKVYRLGGSKGRATAYISYIPTVTEGENGAKIYDYAISADDILVEYEEALPIAQYQEVGKDPEPQTCSTNVVLAEDSKGYVLGIDVEAAAYKWQIFADGAWKNIDGGNGATIAMDAGFVDSGDYDFRCVYTDGEGRRFCTDSLMGEDYVPVETNEVVEEAPEDIELNPEPAFLPLELGAEGENPYNAWVFELTFAEGEWEKEIHISSLEDEIPEAYESALFTISSCYGGDVLSSACQMTLSFEDNDESEPSTLGFVVTELRVDKAEGYAELNIERIGGSQNPVTVEYATRDGSAKAGKDYVEAEGKLMFYSGIESLPLRIELIDDGKFSEEELDFSVEISSLLGDDNCSFTENTKATVKLRNSGTGSGDNLASVLYDAQAVEIAGDVQLSESTASSVPDAAMGRQQLLEEEKELPCQLIFGDDAELSTQSFYPNRAAIDFPKASSWKGTENLGQNKSWWTYSTDKGPGASMYGNGEEMSDLAYQEATYTLGANQVGLASRGAASAYFNDSGFGALGTTKSNFGQMFSGISYDITTYYGHDTAYLKGFDYRYSYTMARFWVSQGNSGVGKPACIERHGSGPLNKNWNIYAGDTWETADHNPFSGSYTYNFSYSGDVAFEMKMPYQGSGSHEQDELLDNSAVILKKGELTRRTFAANNFFVELSTPNDSNTAPDGAPVLDTDTYDRMLPAITVSKGGDDGSNRLYVGSQIKVTVGQAPAGYKLKDINVYQSKDGGANWIKFSKFAISGDSNAFYIDTVGSSSNALNSSDLSARYKIRVSYERETEVTISLAPSVPRLADGISPDTSKVSYVYKKEYISSYGNDHNFSTGPDVGANITYGRTDYNDSTGDFTTAVSEKTLAKSSLSHNGTNLKFSTTNAQWINFNLSPKDLLLINGKAYAGNDKIWLSVEDMAGGLNVVYYHEAYRSAVSPMETTFRWVGLYFDANGNGRIDGAYNSDTGIFELAPVGGVSDEFVTYVESDDTVNERALEPKEGRQYFLKVSYNMTPRAITLPDGANIDDKAQVLPAFVTSINADTPAYFRQTDEQRAYRYIVSGQTQQVKGAGYTRSSDNHLMYTVSANSPSMVDIPLGGDSSPAEIVVEGGKSVYKWNPRFMGSMLFPFANPTPITITNSLAGPTQIVGDYTETEKDNAPVYSYDEDQLDRMNGYLASFTGNTTFVLVTQEQRFTTEEIVANVTGVSLGGGMNGASHDDDKYYVQALEDYEVIPDSVTVGGYATIPDSEYLKATSSGGAPDTANVDSGEAGTGMDEFNVDFGVNLGSNDIGITDYVTILLDGNRVGFSISVPMGGFDKALGSGKDGEWSHPGAANKDAWTQFYDFFQKDKGFGDDGYKKAKEAHDAKYPKPSPTPNPAPGGNQGSTPKPPANGNQQGNQQGTNAPANATSPKTGNGSKLSSSKSFSVEFSVSLAMLFEYDPLSNDYYFCMMSFSAHAGGSFRVEARLTVFPVVYLYVQLSVSIDFSTGMGRVRDSKEAETPLLDATRTNANGDMKTLFHNAKGSYEAGQEQFADFITPYKSFNIRFDGRLAMQVYEKNSSGQWVRTEDDDIRTGVISSDGSKDVEIILKQTDSMYLGSGENDEYLIRFVALDTDGETETDVSKITRFAEIVDTRDEVYFEGIEITPAVAVEIGAGIGVELLKFEAYFVVSVDATITLALFNEHWLDNPELNKYRGIGLENFNFNASIGLRVVLLIFTFELDAASFWAGYDGAVSDGIDGKEWDYSISFFNGAIELDAEEDPYAGMTVNLPGSLNDPTTLFTLEDNLEDDLSTQAYNPTDSRVPFQLSGYSSSVDAAALGDNMLLGGDYKAVSAGGRDFVVYTLSRGSAAEEDTSFLVMSEIVSNGTTYGLANPANNSNATPYIVLDTETEATGDLDFDVWVEEADGSCTIHAAWVSYAAPANNGSEPTKPGGEVYSKNGIEMNADNYNNADLAPDALRAEPVAPDMRDPALGARPTEAVDEPKLVVESDYITAENAIDEATYNNGVTVQTDYVIYSGSNAELAGKYVLASEKAAYDTAVAEYPGKLEAYEAYVKLKGEWDAYDADAAQYELDKAAYEEAVDSYNLWKNYYTAKFSYDEYVTNRLAIAARNTVVKTAEWSFGDAGFSNAATVGGDGSGGSVNYVFAPASAGDGSIIFYGSTAVADGGAALAAYKSFANAAYAQFDSNGYISYMVNTQKSMLDIFGTASALNLAYKANDGTWKTATTMLVNKDGGAGQTLSNVEFTKIGNDYYVAYTTKQETYVNYTGADGNTTVDQLGTERLFLRRVNIAADGTVNWGDPYLIRTLYDYERDSGKDGVYKGGAIQSEYENPYFANLGFLTAKIDKDMLTGVEEEFETMAVAEHDFLIFEMNGSTYIILDDSLESITDPAKEKGTIYPFFTPATGVDDKGNPVTETSSGKQEVTIGVDGDGNVFAVYVGAVQGTSNNALFLSAFDAASGTWGSGTMLAMNHMDTYEASIRNGWGQRTTSAAYLGLSGKDGGLLSKQDIGNLYGDDIAEDIYATLSEAANSELGNSGMVTFGNIQALKGVNDELLVLTEATRNTLEVKKLENNHVKTGPVDTYVLSPEYDAANQHLQSTIGFYAIGYGKGDQELGQGSIAFGNADFSVGTELYVDITAFNTGDTAFRGSEAQPITATLRADGKEIGRWNITENIVAGQQLSLSGTCLALPSDLKDDDEFVLTVAEYTGGNYNNPASKDLTLFTVELLPELSIEDMEISVADISDDGSKTTLDVEFIAANRGAKLSTDPYIQFSYASGEDSEGETVYTVLDITGNTLDVSDEFKLETQAVTGDDFKNGILFLDDINKGFGRRVSGTITVDSDVFAAGESRHLELRAEIFDQSSSTVTSYSAGREIARHGEYNTDNNVSLTTVEAGTEFTASSSIVIAMGSTTMIPVSAVNSRGSTPKLVAEEILDTDGRNIGILNFKAGGGTGGSIQGVVSISPVKVGEGVIHVTDTETNTRTAIAFKVVDAAEGIDIFNDNSAFSFFNANGNAYDPEGTNQDWSFDALNKWGSGSAEEVPMRSNASKGKPGASFSFETVAESFDLYFQGEVEISSDRPGFATQTYTNAGGSKPVAVTLGANADYEPYTVTVKVAGNTAAYFDRLTEKYTNNQVPVPTFDGENPVLIWKRSVPGTASLKPGSGVDIGFYAVDNKSIAEIVVNGVSYDGSSAAIEKVDEEGLCWLYSFGSITRNGSYEIVIKDNNGNKTSATLVVDWFLEGVAATTSPVPNMTVKFTKNGADWDNSVIGPGDTAKFRISTTTGNTEISAIRYVEADSNFETPLSPDSGAEGIFSVAANGLYLATVRNTADGSFVNEMRVMDKIDTSTPAVAIALNDAKDGLVWNASKETNVAPISEVRINGYKVNTASGKNLSGTFPVDASGRYTISAKDSAGNSAAPVTVDVLIPVEVSECVFTPAAVTNEARNNGSITVEFANARGGYYSDAGSAAVNSYDGSYAAALVKGMDDLGLVSSGWVEGTAATFRDLTEGTYYVAIKDLNADDLTEDRYTVIEIVVPDYSTHVSLSYSDGVISWKADKNEESGVKLVSAKINGFELIASPGNAFDESFDVSFNGDYKLVVTDENGHSSEAELKVTDRAIDLSACSFVANPAWNQAKNNGSIDVNLEGVLGGYYSDGDYAANEYYGRYKVTAVPAAYDLAGIDADGDISWIILRDTGWTHRFTGFEPGDYKLVVRDVTNPDNEPIQTTVLFTIEDIAMVMDTEPVASSVWHAHDGQIITEATGGIGSHFEYAAILISGYEKEYSETPLEQFFANDPDEIEWNVLTNGGISSGPDDNGTISGVIEGLATGQYLVAVRTLLGAEEEKLAEMDALARDCLDAYAELDAALKDGKHSNEQIEILRKAAEEAEKDYTAVRDEVTRLSAAYYKDNPEYREGIVADRTFVGTNRGPSHIRNTYTDENGSIVYELYDISYALTSSDYSIIGSAVNNRDIVFTAEGFSVYVPEDSLRSGFDFTKLFIDPGKAGDGMVVEYTAPDGSKSIVPWCLVEEGKVSYVSVGEGSYALVPAEAYFSDIEGLWGEDNIYFTASRQLFNGVGNDCFGPKMNMTRAMFVTVLWRMAGSPEAEGGTGFTDLKADWYAEAVEWAVENRITEGYSKTVFAPNDNVTREQMCVFLCRFLEYLGHELPEGESIDFADADRISAWAVEQVDACSASGLIQGMGNNTFAPKNNATRMEVSTLLARFITQIVEKYTVQ